MTLYVVCVVAGLVGHGLCCSIAVLADVREVHAFLCGMSLHSPVSSLFACVCLCVHRYSVRVKKLCSGGVTVSSLPCTCDACTFACDCQALDCNRVHRQYHSAEARCSTCTKHSYAIIVCFAVCFQPVEAAAADAATLPATSWVASSADARHCDAFDLLMAAEGVGEAYLEPVLSKEELVRVVPVWLACRVSTSLVALVCGV